jgi:DNA-nicking Smr family endonuclease
MKRIRRPKKAPIQATNRGLQEELLWVAEHGDVPTIDLHGLSTLAAEHELEQFIHSQSYRRIQVVSIIHGHGTGKLKDTTERWLKANPELIAYARPCLGTRGSGVILALLHN